MKLKPFQKQDYARLALVPGAILAHEPGLGKTWAAIVWALLKNGYDVTGSARVPLGSTRVSRVLTSSPQPTPSTDGAGELGQCPRDAGAIRFHAGQRYALRTQSVQITRRGVRPSLTGEPEEIEYTGQELAMLITDVTGVERVFMEARLRDPKITVHPISIDGGARPSRSPSPASRRRRGSAPAQSSGPFQIDFTLQELAAHFIIPEVADVAAMDPEGFQRNLRALEELEGVLG